MIHALNRVRQPGRGWIKRFELHKNGVKRRWGDAILGLVHFVLFFNTELGILRRCAVLSRQTSYGRVS